MLKTYQYQARSQAAFIAQVIRYVSSGYYFYVRCIIPEGKNVSAVDEKLLSLYHVRQPRWRREKRNRDKSAAAHYLRYDRTFVLMLTHGRHDTFYRDHGQAVSDIRRQALKVFGYSIRYTTSKEEQRLKVFVRLDRERYRELKNHLTTIAAWNSYASRELMEREFSRLPVLAYGPVIRQMWSILREVNRVRSRRGFPRLSSDCLPTELKPTKVFVDPSQNN